MTTKKKLFRKIRILSLNFFNLQDSTDIPYAIKSISGNIYIKGANIWILICSAMLSSLGLDTNSAAVIIGAMLISPLMSPILGIGLGIGINDQDLLKKSLESFGIAILLSLFTSTIYFLITPLGIITPEISSRTSPTILDAGIAAFGGLAGIIAVSRKEIPNAVPGVAIATALMPPLCTSGFGIASGNFSIFLGAFYLFFLNAVLISLTAYFIVRLLKFPYKEILDEAVKVHVHRGIAILVTLMLIPGAIIFYNVIKEIDSKNKIERFIQNNISDNQTEVLRWDKIDLDSSVTVKVYITGKGLDENKTDELKKQFRNVDENYNIKIIQLNLTENEKQELMHAAAFNALQAMELSKLAEKVKSEKEMIQDYLFRLDSTLNASYRSVKILFPEVENVSCSFKADSDSIILAGTPLIDLKFKRGTGRYRQREIQERVNNFLLSQVDSFTRPPANGIR